MLLIIQIALGIVLAWVLIKLLPYIIEIGMAGLALGFAALVLVAIAAAFIHLSNAKSDELIGWASIAGFLAFNWAVAFLVNHKWPHLETYALFGTLFLVSFWMVGAVTIISDFWNYYQSYPLSIVVLLIIGAVGWYYILRWNQKLLIEWRTKTDIDESYGRSR